MAKDGGGASIGPIILFEVTRSRKCRLLQICTRLMASMEGAGEPREVQNLFKIASMSRTRSCQRSGFTGSGRRSERPKKRGGSSAYRVDTVIRIVKLLLVSTSK
jgi:hypothetical protein